MSICECSHTHIPYGKKTPVTPNYDNIKDLYSYSYKINEEIYEYALNDNNRDFICEF